MLEEKNQMMAFQSHFMINYSERILYPIAPLTFCYLIFIYLMSNVYQFLRTSSFFYHLHLIAKGTEFNLSRCRESNTDTSDR